MNTVQNHFNEAASNMAGPAGDSADPLEELHEPMAETAEDLTHKASHLAEDLQTRAREAWDTAQDRTQRAVRESSIYVRDNPVPVALGALVVGILLGRLFSARPQETFQERYISEPLHKSHGLLLGLLLAAGAMLRRTLSTASHAAGEWTGHVESGLHDSLQPLRRAAVRTRRKAGL